LAESGLHLAEQVQSADDPAAQPHRQRVGRAIARMDARCVKLWPPLLDLVEVDVHELLTGAEAVQSRPLGVLQHEQLEHPGFLGGRCHHLQAPMVISQDQPSGVGLQQLDAAVAQQVEKVDDVEVIDKRVGELDEHSAEALLTGHDLLPFRSVSCQLRMAGSLIMIVVWAEGQPSGDNLVGEFEERPIGGVGAGLQQQQRLGQTDARLHRDHPSRLMDFSMPVGRLRQQRMHLPRRSSARLAAQGWHGGSGGIP
jgi:hypothetical protein